MGGGTCEQKVDRYLIIDDGFKRLDEGEAAEYPGLCCLCVEGLSISWIQIVLGVLGRDLNGYIAIYINDGILLLGFGLYMAIRRFICLSIG